MLMTERHGDNVMNEITLILYERDGVNPSDASKMYLEFIEDVKSSIESNPRYDIEEALRDEFGLEPDYIEIILDDLMK